MSATVLTGEFGQALYAYSLSFHFQTDAGALSYLDGKTFTVQDVPFVQNISLNTTYKQSAAHRLLLCF